VSNLGGLVSISNFVLFVLFHLQAKNPKSSDRNFGQEFRSELEQAWAYGMPSNGIVLSVELKLNAVGLMRTFKAHTLMVRLDSEGKL
jgi:hypothetical protein